MKDIKGFEGKYAITKDGKVYSYVSGRFLKNRTYPNGYKYVSLGTNTKTYLVHRLVAQAFLENPNNFKEINHKDEDKSNNDISNLEWCDRKYNNNYGTARKRHGEKMKGQLAGEKNPNYGKGCSIICVETGEVFQNIAEANEYLGKDRRSGNIGKCLTGKNKKAWGYTWAYCKEDK